VPLQIPPLELSELFAGWQNGGVKQSNNQYKAVTVICCDRFFAAMCRFKFRLRLKATVNSAFENV